MVREGVFVEFRARYIAFIWLFSVFFAPGIEPFLNKFASGLDWYWWDLAYYYYGHSLLAIVLVASMLYWRVPFASLFGSIPSGTQIWSGLKLTAFTFIFSFAAIYIVFYPLTFISEPFVKFWLIDLSPIIYFTDLRRDPVPGSLEVPFFANLLGFVSICVIAPLTEELAFRGLLLHRWAAKWGIWPAIFTSSALFGLVHPDVLGAFVFGVAMSIIYLKTQSLVLVIGCHAANNAVAWIMEFAYYLESDFTYQYTLEDFYGDWTYGVASLIVCAIWAAFYLRGPESDKSWRLPVT